MLFFGHIGLTIGITKVFQNLMTSQRRDLEISSSRFQPSTNRGRKDTLLIGIQKKMRFIDYRFILLGSLLPDIIDKPVWLFTSSSVRWDGRGYSHTFLFSFVLLVIGLVLAARRKKAQSDIRPNVVKSDCFMVAAAGYDSAGTNSQLSCSLMGTVSIQSLYLRIRVPGAHHPSIYFDTNHHQKTGEVFLKDRAHRYLPLMIVDLPL
jgi:hypothetical protein